MSCSIKIATVGLSLAIVLALSVISFRAYARLHSSVPSYTYDVAPRNAFFFYLKSHGQLIVSVDSAGRVEFGQGVTMDDASRQFWRAVASRYVHVCGGDAVK